MKAPPIRLPASLILMAGFAAAQASDLDPRVQALEQKVVAQKHLLNDFGGLIRYGSDNAEIGPPKPGEDRVVFLGDQVTEQWGARFFPGKPFLNRGIGGQTSAQMLVRFHQDVVALKSK